MIKRLFGALLLTLSITANAQRTGSMVIDTHECEYDTVAYKEIGPGTTYMKLQFPAILNKAQTKTYKMIMYVLKVDLTNHFVKISPYLAKGKYYQLSNQEADADRLYSYEDQKVLATAMGNAFWASTAITAARTSNEVCNSVVSDSKVFYDEGDSYAKFSIDENRIAHVTSTTLDASATFGTSTLAIGQINHHRDIADNKGKLSLFCNGLPKSVATDTSIGVDVRLSVNSNNGCILVGHENQCTVTAIEDGCGHSISKGEAILAGIGDCETTLRSLKVGDVVNISVLYNSSAGNGMNITTQLTTFSGTTKQSYSILNGSVKSCTKGNYAITSYGCSADGKTAYIGALQISDGTSDAPCKYLSEAMKNLGVWNAIWVDGGPSSEMTVNNGSYCEFVTTSNLGGQYNGRPIPSGVAIISTAPNDMNMVSIKMDDESARNFNIGDTFAPVIYGYNNNGEIVDYNAEKSANVSITCDSNIGTFDNGVFTATTVGTGNIIIALNGTSSVITIPVTVTDARTLSVVPAKIFTGEGRSCQIQAYLTKNGETTMLHPTDVTWSTDASFTIQSCDNGYIVPFMDGAADIKAEYQGLSANVDVTVENLDEEGIQQIDYKSDVNGLTQINKHLQSVPTSFSIELVSAPNSTVTVYYTTGDTQKTYECPIPATGITTVNIPLDYESNETYPVSVDYITGTSTTNLEGYDTPYIISDLTACYNNFVPTSITDVQPRASKSQGSTYNTMGMKVSSQYRGIVIKNGNKYLSK